MGKLTNVTAMKASEVLQSVRIAEKPIIEVVDKKILFASGRMTFWSIAVLNTAATAAPIIK